MKSSIAESKLMEFDWGRIDWLASGEQGNSDAMTFGRVTILAGCANPRHLHPNCEEILHLAAGSLTHTLGDASIAMSAGDTITIPSGIFHNATAVGSHDAVMYVAFSSPDRQFEPES